jgi:hypothetical protein
MAHLNRQDAQQHRHLGVGGVDAGQDLDGPGAIPDGDGGRQPATRPWLTRDSTLWK